jgi:hypothetical protein
MSLVGVKHPGKIQAIQWCNCRGSQHRIALINNRIVLLDHKLELELAMLDLGGAACSCVQIYLDIRNRETKRVIPAFAPFIDEMLKKKRLRNYGNRMQQALKKTSYAPKHVQQLVKLLIRLRCCYEHELTTIHVTNTGSAFAKSCWLYNHTIGGEKGRVLQVNIDKDWKTNIYDRGIAVVDDKIVISSKGRNNGFDDISVVIMDYDTRSSTFGTRNATIMKAHDKWRFKYMEATVTHNDFRPNYWS